MRKTYHFCISSHDEVMFRSQEDIDRGFNCLAYAILTTESRLLADGFMSDHVHSGLQTDSITEVVRRFRYAYTRYFNYKYHRRGRLGECRPFVLEMDGARHITTGICYVLRQGLHHGLSETPFDYPNCSANAIFRRQLGKTDTPPLIEDRLRYLHLPDTDFKIPSAYRMSESGLLLREDIIDTSYVEELFITPRNYLFYMNRLSSEEWEREQKEENPSIAPITMNDIEKCKPSEEVRQMFLHERGRVDKSMMTDLELCKIIDEELIPKYYPVAGNIYRLGPNQRKSIGNIIYSKFKDGYMTYSGQKKKFTLEQLRRCLCL